MKPNRCNRALLTQGGVRARRPPHRLQGLKPTITTRPSGIRTRSASRNTWWGWESSSRAWCNTTTSTASVANGRALARVRACNAPWPMRWGESTAWWRMGEASSQVGSGKGPIHARW